MFAALLLLLAAPVAAQIVPQPDPGNPRIQTVAAAAGQEIAIAALPGTNLTLVFGTNERIDTVQTDQARLAYTITPERNAINLTPLVVGGLGTIEVVTDRARYRFTARTGLDLMAAYVVRVVLPGEAGVAATGQAARPDASVEAERWWSYKVSGKEALRPVGIRDDGEKTYILFSPDQMLPAIFAISPTGDETLTNGYMRGADFVLDRVWDELVFRIDGKKATAKRNEQPDD